ncbi:hypothetical protein PLEOSDRAFT_1108628 [Pleurotus ostreatus PC15]|uniref:Uncharacterized protein n=1 Tax=Pleurotus ostreatus (strain PC15) TaxID=1137138 RepID=A0A067NB37_PLEO1|nr:hypothetical protein PLEOSDRAFT_1108628 [Pleurotus ostreatus PC15]
MSTRRHPDSKAANPTIVPRFPRPFDGKKTVPPPVLTVNPADTIGKVDDMIVIDDIPRARDRVVCECGVELTRSYLEKHRLTAKHAAALAKATAKAGGAKQKKGGAVRNGHARAAAPGAPSEHGLNDADANADADAHEYTAFDRTYFEADSSSLMTNPYYSQDAYIHG